MSTAKPSAHGEYHHHTAHHFENAEAEYNASTFGVWLFLCTELVMFGGLFVGYVIYHGRYPEIFHNGAKFLDWRLGALNTVVLLFSSLTMALSIYYAQLNRKKMVLINLYITLACAFVFLGVKYIEWSHKFHEGLLPGRFFSYEGPESHVKNIPMYFSFYFCMTGLHASHVIAGMCLIGWLIRRAHKGHFSSTYYTPLECVGLFWHLVDLVWIYLFPLLYLIG
jgi:cytochrome c oxidase subunit III